MTKRHPAKARKDVAEGEYQTFAERFAKLILDSRQPWMLQYLLAGGFDRLPLASDLDSGGFALGVLNRMDLEWLLPIELAEPAFQGDRHALTAVLKQRVTTARLTIEDMALLLKIAEPAYFRQSLRDLIAPFRRHRGAQPKLPMNGYSTLLAKANLLEPAILAMLNQLQQSTRSIEEILQYLQKDHLESCKYLLARVDRLKQVMNAPKLLKRAEKRPEARARVLAAALAGSEFRLSFRTSVERVRQARHLEKKSRTA